MTLAFKPHKKLTAKLPAQTFQIFSHYGATVSVNKKIKGLISPTVSKYITELKKLDKKF